MAEAFSRQTVESGVRPRTRPASPALNPADNRVGPEPNANRRASRALWARGTRSGATLPPIEVQGSATPCRSPFKSSGTGSPLRDEPCPSDILPTVPETGLLGPELPARPNGLVTPLSRDRVARECIRSATQPRQPTHGKEHQVLRSGTSEPHKGELLSLST